MTDSLCPFLELPAEVFEKIIFYLDGNALSNLKSASKKTRDRIKPIASSAKGEEFWEAGCQPYLICTSNSVLKSIIASYLTVLDETIRTKALEELKLFRANPKIVASPLSIWRPKEIIETCVTWEDAFEWHNKYLGKISYPQMRLEHMKDVERILKDKFQLFYGLSWTEAVAEPEKKWPMQFISTCGPTLYHFMGPIENLKNPDSMTFYENMTESRRSTLRMEPADIVYSCKLVVLNFHWDTAMVRPILVLQMHPPALWLCPVNEGRPLKIGLPFNNQEYPTHVWQPNPYTFWGNLLAIFENPLNLKVYLINMDLAGNLAIHSQVQSFTSVLDGQLPTIWKSIQSAGSAYCFALGTELAFPSVIGRHPQAKVYGRQHCYYTFVFTGETICFDGSTYRTFTPKIYGGDYFESMRDPKFEYDHATILLWTENIFACPFGFHIWAVSNWSRHIPDFSSVSLVEIIDNHTIMLCVNAKREAPRGLASRIVLAKIIIENDKEGERGSVEVSLNIIRIIRLEPALFRESASSSKITRFHFDFDRGRPYIFLVAEHKQSYWKNMRFSKCAGSVQIPKSAYISLTFQLMKVTFQDLEGELSNSSKIVHDFDPSVASAAAVPDDEDENGRADAEFPDQMLENLLECLRRFEEN